MEGHAFLLPRPKAAARNAAPLRMTLNTDERNSTALSSSAAAAANSSSQQQQQQQQRNNNNNKTRYYLGHPFSAGRLGNQMFEWASTVGIALSNNLEPCRLQTSSSYGRDLSSRTFDKGTSSFPVCPGDVQEQEDDEHLNVAREGASQKYGLYYKAYNGTTMKEILHRRRPWKFVGSRHFVVHGHLESFKYFEDIEERIRRDFRFNEGIRRTAEEFYHNQYLHNNDTTTVGIHVRRGDMLLASNPFKSPSIGFFESAMRYFRTKYTNVKFVVTTDDKVWCKSQNAFQAVDVLISMDRKPAEDIAILARCHHMIVSVGTFGWWAAWLGAHHTHGEVIYYRDALQFIPDAVPEDYYPSSWIAMGDGDDDETVSKTV